MRRPELVHDEEADVELSRLAGVSRVRRRVQPEPVVEQVAQLTSRRLRSEERDVRVLEREHARCFAVRAAVRGLCNDPRDERGRVAARVLAEPLAE